jgi:hypothetical protein
MASCPRCGANVTVADIRRARVDRPGSHCPSCELPLTIAAASWWRLAGVCAVVMAVMVWVGRDRLPEAWGPILAVVAALALQPLWWRFLVTLRPAAPPVPPAAPDRRP